MIKREAFPNWIIYHDIHQKHEQHWLAYSDLFHQPASVILITMENWIFNA